MVNGMSMPIQNGDKRYVPSAGDKVNLLITFTNTASTPLTCENKVVSLTNGANMACSPAPTTQLLNP